MSLKNLLMIVISILSLPPLSTNVLAHCPLCTAATGSAVLAARWFGIDDLITGTLIGAFIVSTAFWFHLFLRKFNNKKNYVPLQLPVILISTVVFTLAGFYIGGLFVDDGMHLVLGINRLMFGSLVGIIVTLVAFTFNDLIRVSNSNKNLVPFQAILITLLFLLVANFGFYIAGMI